MKRAFAMILLGGLATLVLACGTGSEGEPASPPAASGETQSEKLTKLEWAWVGEGESPGNEVAEAKECNESIANDPRRNQLVRLNLLLRCMKEKGWEMTGAS